MSVEISINVDARQVMKYLGHLPSRLQAALSAGIRAAAFLIERESKLRTPVDTGRLRSSIYTFSGHLYATVSTNVNYARYVHQGTRNMRPRPFMAQGLKAARYNIGKIIDREVTRALN